MQRRTRYQVYLDPVSYVYIRTSDSMSVHPLIQPSHRTHHNNKPGFCVPTKAVLKYTSRGFPQASANMSFHNFPERTSDGLPLMLRLPALPSHPSLQTTAALQAALLLSYSGHVFQLHEHEEQPLLKVPCSQALLR